MAVSLCPTIFSVFSSLWLVIRFTVKINMTKIIFGSEIRLNLKATLTSKKSRVRKTAGAHLWLSKMITIIRFLNIYIRVYSIYIYSQCSLCKFGLNIIITTILCCDTMLSFLYNTQTHTHTQASTHSLLQTQ